MIFEVKYRDEKGQFCTVDLSAPSKLDAYIKFMIKFQNCDIITVKKAKPKPVCVQKKKNFKKRLVSFTISPPELLI